MMEWKTKIVEQLAEAIRQRAIKPNVADIVRENLGQDREFCMIYSSGRSMYMGIMFVRQGKQLVQEAINKQIYNITKLAEIGGISEQHVKQYIIKTYGTEGYKIIMKNQ
jgi:hypothetical protein